MEGNLAEPLFDPVHEPVAEEAPDPIVQDPLKLYVRQIELDSLRRLAAAHEIQAVGNT